MELTLWGCVASSASTMKLSRKDFLSGSLALPFSFAAAGVSFGGQKAAPVSDAPFFNVRQFGARGDGQVKDTRAIQEAMDAAGLTGGTVFLPPGSYLSGTVRFKSHVTVFLDAGATLIFS